MASIWPTIVALLCTLLSVPITYVYNTYGGEFPEHMRVGYWIASFLAVYLCAVILTANRVKNRLYYVLTVPAVLSGVDAIMLLEKHGKIKGFLTLYLENPDPYHSSIFGYNMCGYGVVMLIFLIKIIYSITNGSSFKNAGLFYSAGCLNFMLVLLLAMCIVEQKLNLKIGLGAIVILLNIRIMMDCFSGETKQEAHTKRSASFLDILLAILLVGAAVGAGIKGLISLGSENIKVLWYEEEVEPLLKQIEPAPYAHVQSLITLFYFLPAYLTLAGGLTKSPGQEWLRNLSAILAGASLNAGVLTIGGSIHPWTSAEYNPSSNHKSREFIAFWACNLLMSVVPQLVALRLCSSGKEDRHETRHQIKKRN